MWPAPGGDRQPRFPEAHRPRCVPGTRGAGAFRPRVSRGRRQLGSCWAKRLLEVPTLSLAMSPSLGPPFGRAGFLCESRGPGGAGVVPPLRAPLSLGPVPGLPRAHHPPRSRVSVGVRAAPASLACWARLIHACALGLCGEPRGGGVGGSGVLDTWGGGGWWWEEGSAHPTPGRKPQTRAPRAPCGAGSGTQQSRLDDKACFAKTRFAADAHAVVMRGRAPPRGAHGTATSERAASGDVSRLWLRRPFEGGRGSLLRVRSRRPSPAAWPGRSPQPRSCFPRGARCRQGPQMRVQRSSRTPSCRWPCRGWSAVLNSAQRLR